MPSNVLPDPDEYTRLAPKPGSPVWVAFNDARLMSTAGFATLLQVAHPTVGAGVHDHSSFTRDPFGRLLRTLDYVNGTVYGGPEVAGRIGAAIRGMHKSIRGTREDGTPYNSMEPGAFAWVHATLALAVFEGHRHLKRPMSDVERQAFWAQWRDVGRLIGVRYRDLPEDVADFDTYIDETVERDLEWTPAVPELLGMLGSTSRPRGVPVNPTVWRIGATPLTWQMLLVTKGLLPPVLRDRLGIAWTRRDATAFAVVTAAARASGPLMVGPLAHVGEDYLRRRQRAIGRRASAPREAQAA